MRARDLTLPAALARPAASHEVQWATMWPFLVVGAATFVFLLSGIGWINADQNWYLKEGVRLAQGEAYSYNLRPPLLPGILAAVFRILPPSVEAAHLVIKLAYAGLLWLAFLLARKMYSNAVALTSAILIAGTPFLIEQSTYFMPDGVLAFLMFLILYAIVQALETEQHPMWWWAGASLACGAAFYIKETGLFWAVVPVVAWLLVPVYRTRKTLRGIVVFVIGTGLIALAWWIYYYLITGQIYLLSTVDVSSAAAATTAVATTTAATTTAATTDAIAATAAPFKPPFGPAQAILVILQPSINYVENVIRPAFALFPVFAAAWLYTGFHALRRSRFDVILFTAFAVYFPPVLLVVGSNAPGPVSLRNFIPVLVLSIIVTVRVLADVAAVVQTWATRVGFVHSHRLLPLLLVVGAVALLGRTAAAGEFATLEKPQVLGKAPAWEYNWYNSIARLAATDVETLTPPGSHIMATWQWANQIDFWTNNSRDFYQFPSKKVTLKPNHAGLEIVQDKLWGFIDNSLSPKPPGKNHLLFLDRRTWLEAYIAVREDDITSMVHDNQIEYLLFTGDTYMHPYAMETYFDAHPGYEPIQLYSEQIGGIDYGYTIYRVHPEEVVNTGAPMLAGAYTLNTILLDEGGLPIPAPACMERLASLNPNGVRVIAARLSKNQIEGDSDVLNTQALLEACASASLAADPSNAAAASTLAWIFFDQGQFRRLAIELAPYANSFSQSTRAILHSAELVQSAFENGIDDRQQATLLTSAVTSQGANGAFVRNLAHFIRSNYPNDDKQRHAALQTLTNAYEQQAPLAPNDFRGLVEMAAVFSELGAADAADALYRSLPDRWPDNADAYLLAGRAALEANNNNAARETLTTALEKGLFDARILPLLADVFRATPPGSEQTALLETLQSATNLYPNALTPLDLGKLLLQVQ